MSAETVLIFALFVLSVVIHEVAHGVAALWLGDPTAKQAGRLTLDPLRHIDPFMTILLPLMMYIGSGGQFMFGGAKPVPVDPRWFRDPRRGMMWTALAGPGSNLLLAVFFALCVHALAAVAGPEPSEGIKSLAGVLIKVGFLNIFLAFFNLIPIPPLDGGRVVTGLLPYHAAREFSRLEPYGMFILIGLIVTGMTRLIVGPAIYFFGLLF